MQERVYDENGRAKTDTDYTGHGNPSKHQKYHINITGIGQTLSIR